MNVVQRRIRSKAVSDPADEFMAAVHLKFASMTALADKLGVTVQFLSQIRSKRKRMPVEMAERIERLIGYPATRWER